MWEKKVWILYQYLKILLSSARLKRMYCWTLYIVISFFKCNFCKEYICYFLSLKISRKLSNNLNLKRKWPRFLMYLLLSRCLLTYIENIVKKVQCQMCVWVSQIFPLMLNSKFEKKIHLVKLIFLMDFKALCNSTFCTNEYLMNYVPLRY